MFRQYHEALSRYHPRRQHPGAAGDGEKVRSVTGGDTANKGLQRAAPSAFSQTSPITDASPGNVPDITKRTRFCKKGVLLSNVDCIFRCAKGKKALPATRSPRKEQNDAHDKEYSTFAVAQMRKVSLHGKNDIFHTLISILLY